MNKFRSLSIVVAIVLFATFTQAQETPSWKVGQTPIHVNGELTIVQVPIGTQIATIGPGIRVGRPLIMLTYYVPLPEPAELEVRMFYAGECPIPAVVKEGYLNRNLARNLYGIYDDRRDQVDHSTEFCVAELVGPTPGRSGK